MRIKTSNNQTIFNGEQKQDEKKYKKIKKIKMERADDICNN